MDTRALADIMLRLVCLCSGDRKGQIDETVRGFWEGGKDPIAIFSGRRVSESSFGLKYGAALRLLGKEFLRALGCPEHVIEQNLKFIMEAAGKEHITFEVKVPEEVNPAAGPVSEQP